MNVAKSDEIIEIYKQGKYKEAARALLDHYEHYSVDSNIWNKFRRPDIIQRLGYEMAHDTEIRKRLEKIAPKVLSSERQHLLWLVPELMERGLSLPQRDMYRRMIKRMLDVFGTNSIEGVARAYDEANVLGIEP